MRPNIDYIKKLADGSREFEEKMIEILKEEYPREKELFLEYFDNDHLMKAADMIHKIKHKFSMLGMEDEYMFSVDFEEQLRVENIVNYPDFLAILNITDNYIKEL